MLQALSHLETTLRTALLVLKALLLQLVPQVARPAKLELRRMKAEVLVLLAKLELLQGRQKVELSGNCVYVHLFETVFVVGRYAKRHKIPFQPETVRADL